MILSSAFIELIKEDDGRSETDRLYAVELLIALTINSSTFSPDTSLFKNHHREISTANRRLYAVKLLIALTTNSGTSSPDTPLFKNYRREISTTNP